MKIFSSIIIIAATTVPMLQAQAARRPSLRGHEARLSELETVVAPLPGLITSGRLSINDLQAQISQNRLLIDSIEALQGPAGPMGPEGPQGPIGPQGPRGLNGQDGALAGLSCSVGEMAIYDGTNWICSGEQSTNSEQNDCLSGYEFTLVVEETPSNNEQFIRRCQTGENTYRFDAPWIDDSFHQGSNYTNTVALSELDFEFDGITFFTGWSLLELHPELLYHSSGRGATFNFTFVFQDYEIREQLQPNPFGATDRIRLMRIAQHDAGFVVEGACATEGFNVKPQIDPEMGRNIWIHTIDVSCDLSEFTLMAHPYVEAIYGSIVFPYSTYFSLLSTTFDTSLDPQLSFLNQPNLLIESIQLPSFWRDQTRSRVSEIELWKANALQVNVRETPGETDLPH